MSLDRLPRVISTFPDHFDPFDPRSDGKVILVTLSERASNCKLLFLQCKAPSTRMTEEISTAQLASSDSAHRDSDVRWSPPEIRVSSIFTIFTIDRYQKAQAYAHADKVVNANIAEFAERSLRKVVAAVSRSFEPRG